MKTGITFFLICISFTLFAQFATLEPDNPAPRVGEQVGLNITLQNKDLSDLERKSDLTTREQELLQQNRVASGSLKVSQMMTDTGWVEIGPFSFTFQNKTYETAVIALRVRPALPSSATEGIWVNALKFSDYYFVVVEQRIPNKFKRDPNDPNTIRLDAEDLTFAELNQDKLLTYGLEFVSSRISTDNQFLGKNPASGSVAYKLATYKFKPLPSFKGKIKIDRGFFINFPRGIKLVESVIN